MRVLRFVLAGVAFALAFASAASASYPWPIKPFDEQHPIRGFFGDPRTLYENGVLADPFEGPGVFTFHQGIDIAAPNGTPVYAVATGTAHYLGASTLNLDTGKDVVFQYFHITPVVGEDEHVIVRQTLLGYVQPPYAHVHLTEIDGSRAVNPLQEGHLTPYRDTTRPTIRDIVIRNQSGDLQTPLGMCGRVEFAVDAFDTPPVPVPGVFQGLPVAPTLVRWSVGHLNGRIVIPWRTAADFRTTLPGNSAFWNIYAKGTYENAPRFGAQQYATMPGRYLFLLASNFDTTSLPNGVYLLSVRVSDERANTARLSERFSVLNARSGACPGSLPAPPAANPPSTEPPSSTP
jgi:hypothetical protein